MFLRALTMPIPDPIDGTLAEIDDLHASILVGLRAWHHGGPNRDPRRVRETLQASADAVVRLVSGDGGE
jgi:hypothetical protein